MTAFDEERLTGIGGSEAAAVLGISPWATPYDVWLAKIGEAKPLPPSERMRWGTLLEDVIAEEYARRTGYNLEKPPMLRHPEYSWMVGHVDRQVIGERRIVEVKCAATSIGWGEEGTDEIPIQYGAQVQHYMLVAGATVADVAVLIGGYDFRLYEVHADEDIAAMLIEQEHAFWECVQTRTPPTPISTKDAVRRWGRLSNPGSVVATEDDWEAIVTLRQCRAERRTLDGVEEAAKIAVMRSLADRGDTLVDLAGVPLATWRLDNGRKGYTVEARAPARKFLLKGEDDG